MWNAVLLEFHNGSVSACVQKDDDWENARTVASFTELEQEEKPQAVEHAMEEARDQAARLNAEELSAELERMLRRP